MDSTTENTSHLKKQALQRQLQALSSLSNSHPKVSTAAVYDKSPAAYGAGDLS
jgi:hypothetical protein